MTTAQDICHLARASGAAGQSWNEFTCLDAVQDFVVSHTGPDSDLAAWRVAFDAGQCDYLSAQGWLSRWTNAPDSYDTFGTITAELCGEWRGGQLRRVLCHPHHVGYQESRYSSGLHPTWDVDPRVEEREAAGRRERWRVEDAARAARREEGLAWLASATETEIEVAKERDEVESRGLTYVELRNEVRRRDAMRADRERAAEWDRCRASVPDGVTIVDDGTPGFRGTWGWVAGEPTHIYYGVRLTNDHRKVADDALVEGIARDHAGSLAMVADSLASGRMRIVSADDVPPEPVVRRIGHDRWKTIVRVTVTGRTVWAGRVSMWTDPIILDNLGRIVRAKAARSAALDAFNAGSAP